MEFCELKLAVLKLASGNLAIFVKVTLKKQAYSSKFAFAELSCLAEFRMREVNTVLKDSLEETCKISEVGISEVSTVTEGHFGEVRSLMNVTLLKRANVWNVLSLKLAS